MSGTYSHHFSSRNIPFGVASSATHPSPQAATRVQDSVIFLQDCHDAGLFKKVTDLPAAVFEKSTLNDFAALPKTVHRGVRQVIQDTIGKGDNVNFSVLPTGAVEQVNQVTMHMPVRIGDFTGR